MLSIEENGYAHLFAYLPETLQWIRLTDGEWSDTAPALHPGSRQIAFASNRNGHWNIFLLDWPRAQINQLTNYPTYAASPSWSPDGRWLAFTAYLHDNLEIAILSMANPQQEPIRLTNDPAADSSPAWAPGGRQIAFVSTRSGNNDIWLADLDKTGDDRFRNLSQTPMVTERLPRWSPDGKKLLWAANAQDGSLSGIYLWDGENPHRPARWLCSGDQAAWDPQGQRLAVISTTPQASFLTFYDLQGNPLAPPARLPGRVRGMIWISEALPSPLPEAYSLAAEVTPSAPWAPVLTPRAPGQRWSLVTLPDLQAPYPQFHDLVDEAFQALRQRVLKETGWDALGTLEYAFVPLTVPLDPGYSRDWLYTGRAFALPFALNDSGWMVAIPEEIAGQTYWTVYLRSRQTGAGIAEPLSDAPWDFSARYSLEPQFYEQGGRFAPVPPGYWVNLTALAQAYGWERLPALPNWRNYVRGARFNQFVLRGGLDWYQAMLELYPPDILITPTPVQPPTLTPTPTPTHTPTPRPTWTPRPTRTPSSTPSPIPTNTPLP
uniref:WD-40 repeat-containing protein n=1 Tax=uncultured Chloroflexota bacterium TaxID=166587 RepID=H5SBH0_9CHLR|nr:WD-40 repeat-containing protein [uncultured Chloroflexota bacterium]